MGDMKAMNDIEDIKVWNDIEVWIPPQKGSFVKSVKGNSQHMKQAIKPYSHISICRQFGDIKVWRFGGKMPGNIITNLDIQNPYIDIYNILLDMRIQRFAGYKGLKGLKEKMVWGFFIFDSKHPDPSPQIPNLKISKRRNI
jgi:hypothetical protein